MTEFDPFSRSQHATMYIVTEPIMLHDHRRRALYNLYFIHDSSQAMEEIPFRLKGNGKLSYATLVMMLLKR